MDINYYEFLGLDRDTLPKPDTKENRILIKNILDTKFQELAPKYHPDRGGDPETFKILLRSITVLGDESLRSAYDGSVNSYFNQSKFDIDWTKYFTYNKDSSAGIFGDIFVNKIKSILNSELDFTPSLSEHGYHWVFNFKYNDTPLTFSIVYNEDEILSLTDGKDFEHTMPFKIYLYFPSKFMKKELDYSSALKDPDSDEYLISPRLKSITYEDLVLIQTTNQKKALEYIDNSLMSDIQNILDNKIIQNRSFETKKTVTEKDLKEFDKSILSKLFKMKTPKYVEDEKAAELIKEIPGKTVKRITTQVIKKKNSN